MTSQDWKGVWDLYSLVAELPETEREDYLRKADISRPAVLDEVRQLIAAHAGRDADSKGGVSDLPEALPSSAHVPDALFGSYKLIERIGEGGMGTVYRAQQEKPLRRTVALKVVKAGLHCREVLARFDIERQALAMMDHPNIARVLDAGTTPDGRPFFVMEYVDGVPITRYCDGRQLSVRARLQLFVAVCQAIQHAHQKGIIHRDVKPSNILVADADNGPVPKVIDFGVAKAIESGIDDATRATEFGSFVGTFEYMSPEQSAFSQTDVDTRADIYSLGVVLYEMLTGTTPIEGGRQSGFDIVRVLDQLQNQDALPPSVRLRTSVSSEDIAKRRGTTAHRLYLELRGELDWILLKALEKDRDRRYLTANGLVRDIQRYLNGEPVEAGPVSRAYRLRKLAKKYRVLLATAAAFIFVLLAATVISMRQTMRVLQAERAAVSERDRARSAEQAARAERDRVIAAEAQVRRERNTALVEKNRADIAKASASAVNTFLRADLLAQASAKVQGNVSTVADPEIKVRTALDRAAVNIEGRFEKQPEVEASIRQTIGDTYLDLGLATQAEPHLQRAIVLRTRALGDRHPDTITARERLAMVYKQQGRYELAEQSLERVVRERRQIMGDHSAGTLNSISNLATIYTLRGKYKQSEALLAPALDTYRHILGEQHPETLTASASLATAYQEQGKFAEAERLKIRVLDLYCKSRGEKHPFSLTALNNLANLYSQQGKFTQAEPLFFRAAELGAVVLGEEHPDTMLYTNNLADVRRKMGRTGESERLYNRVLDIRRRTLGEEHPDTLITMMSLGRLYSGDGKGEKAEQLFSKILDIRKRRLGPEHPYTLNSLFELGRALERRGKLAEAENVYGGLVNSRRRILGPQHPSTLAVLVALGRVHVAQQRYREGENALRECLNAGDKPVLDGWLRYSAVSALGASLAGQKRYDEAEPLLRSGYSGMLERKAAVPKEDQPLIEQAEAWLAEFQNVRTQADRLVRP